MKPEARADLTRILTYHILPGTMLAADIGKAIDAGKGKAVLATMGGGTLTATKDGDKIVLTDAAGGKATITKADDKRRQWRHPSHRRRADAQRASPDAALATPRPYRFIMPLPRCREPRYNEVQSRAKGRCNEGDDRTGDPPEEPGPRPVGGRAPQHHPDPVQRADRGARRRLAPPDGDRPRPAGRRKRPGAGRPGRRDDRVRPTPSSTSSASCPRAARSS